MNNSVFGKTMENIRKRVDVKLVTNEKRYQKLISRPNYNHTTIFSENLAAVHMEKTKLLFNKPIYIGMAILELSKELMYDFHYNIMKKKYGDKIILCYMDTDSFIYHIKTNNCYEDMKEMINEFDTSDFKKKNKYKIPLMNKKVIGKMKDENSGKVMTEFVSLKSKMYATKVENKENKKAKGIKNVL